MGAGLIQSCLRATISTGAWLRSLSCLVYPKSLVIMTTNMVSVLALMFWTAAFCFAFFKWGLKGVGAVAIVWFILCIITGN